MRLALLCLIPSALAAAYDPASVMIVVNDTVPAEAGTGKTGASQWVANQYLAARHIPPSNVCHVSVPMACCDNDPHAWDSWSIKWTAFDGMRTKIRSCLTKIGPAKIKYIVPTYGVPSHIESVPASKGDAFSVDSFLAQINSPAPDKSISDNPYFEPNPNAIPPRLAEFHSEWPFYAVVRLDGPSAAISAGLVDKAIAAEKGIDRKSGTGFFDLRHNGDPRDQTMQAAYDACVARKMKCVLNDQAVTGHMIDKAPDTLWAWGWYSGPQVHDVYAFVPGAVGAQLTSYTANFVRRDGTGAWVPLWLRKGITATWGATAEPYNIYANGDLVLRRMWSGYNFAEAFYSAVPRNGFTMMAFGDPLYTLTLTDGASRLP